MKKLVLAMVILVLIVTEASSTINIGGRLLLSPSFKGTIEQGILSSIDMSDVGINKVSVSGELFLNYLEKDYSVRTFLNLPVDLTGNGKLVAGQYIPTNDNDVFRFVSSKFQYNSFRVELGKPFRYEKLVIEPQAVATWSDCDIEVVGKTYHKIIAETSTNLGVGIQASSTLGSNALIEGRAAVLDNGYSAEGSYYWYNKGSFASVGYFAKRLKIKDLSLSVDGPMISAGIMF
jgi:hypothetical protein